MFTEGPHILGPHRGMYTGIVTSDDGEILGRLVAATEKELYEEFDAMVSRNTRQLTWKDRVSSIFRRKR